MVITDEDKLRLYAAVAANASIKEACDELGLPTIDVRRALAQDEEFSALIDMAMEDATDSVESSAYRAAKMGDVQAMKLILAARRAQLYARRVEMTGAGGAAMHIVVETGVPTPTGSRAFANAVAKEDDLW